MAPIFNAPEDPFPFETAQLGALQRDLRGDKVFQDCLYYLPSHYLRFFAQKTSVDQGAPRSNDEYRMAK